jgi:hypothetical protein
VCDGRLVEAIDVLAAETRAHRDPRIDVRLLDLRREAAMAFRAGPGRSPWPPAYDDPFPHVIGRLPEIDAAELTTDLLGGAVSHHGCLLMRGVLDVRQVAGRSRRSTALRQCGTRRRPRADGSWYRPFPAPPAARRARRMVAVQGGTWLADSPASTALVLDALATAGVVDAIAHHFGERPFFSLQKSTLRRSRPINRVTAWHQDGSFLGSDVRTMNVWLTLSKCGADHPAPGMEVVPRRVEAILPADDNLAPSSISADLVHEVAGDTPVIRPEFDPGDGMIFDERFLHRTYLNADMTDDRYAVECWFFAPSHDTNHYVSFLV